MADNRGMKRVAARRWGLSLSLGLCVLLCGGLLLSQAGCQKETSGTKSSAVQEPAAKVVAVEPTAKVVEVQPVTPGNADKPAQGPAQQAKPAEPQPQGTETQAVAGTPKIEVENPLRDGGDVGPDTTQNARFVFKSTGNAPLKILKVGACCGSVTRGVKDGQEYVPGESGTLEVDYYTGPNPGPLQRRLSLQTNDPDHPVVTFSIKANVVLRVDYEPKRLSLALKKDNGGCGDIKVKSLDGQPFSITSFRSTANSITAEFNPDTKATEFVLRPKADIEKLRKNTRGQISIDLTHPECRNLRISYDVLPEFTVSPPQLMVFNLKANEPVQRDVWIINNYGDNFEIESVSSQQGLIKLIESKKVQDVAADGKPAPEGQAGGMRYHLRVEIVAPVAQDNRNVLSDALQVKIKNGETLTVHFRGWLAKGS